MSERYSICIVEDDDKFIDVLRQMLKQYEKDTGVQFDISVFRNGLSFICNYNGCADIVFMDIQMPGQDGLETAQALRKAGHNVVLVFITNMAQFAINGYEVEATDFIIKPLAYSTFSVKLKKILNVAVSRRKSSVILHTLNGKIVLDKQSIYYAESQKHYVVFYTMLGDFRARMSMKDAESLLKDKNFARCNTSFLVNCDRITHIRNNVVTLDNGIGLTISRTWKQDFMDRLTMHVAGR